MDSFAGNNEDPLSLHKYLYGGDDPVDNVDPSGEDFEALDVMDISGMLDSIGFPVAAQAQNRALQLGGIDVDVYVWRGQFIAPFFGQSVGHVMCTKHGSREVILSQFPFTQKVGGKEGVYSITGFGYNRKEDFVSTFADEKRQPSHEYTVSVPDPTDFNVMAAQQRAAWLWSRSPTRPVETQCSTAVWLSLEAGKVTLEKGQVYKANSGTLWPSTVDDWLEEDAKDTATTGVKQRF
jgi:hypothetical protein